SAWRRVPPTRSRFSHLLPTRRARPITTVSARRSSNVSKRGLPETLRMRHDEHYVEALAASAGAPVGPMISIELLDPHPHQPRAEEGGLWELMPSVAEKGVIEPLIVRQRGGRYQIIAGERRYHAAVQVGLRDIPVIVREGDDGDAMELARAAISALGASG